jgi:hypothetical protein
MAWGTGWHLTQALPPEQYRIHEDNPLHVPRPESWPTRVTELWWRTPRPLHAAMHVPSKLRLARLRRFGTALRQGLHLGAQGRDIDP